MEGVEAAVAAGARLVDVPLARGSVEHTALEALTALLRCSQLWNYEVTDFV